MKIKQNMTEKIKVNLFSVDVLLVISVVSGSYACFAKVLWNSFTDVVIQYVLCLSPWFLTVYFCEYTFHDRQGRKHHCVVVLWIRAFIYVNMEADLFHEWSTVAWISLRGGQSICSAEGHWIRLTHAGICSFGEHSAISRDEVECKQTLMRSANPWKPKIAYMQTSAHPVCSFALKLCKLWGRSFCLSLHHSVVTCAWDKAPLTNRE